MTSEKITEHLVLTGLGVDPSEEHGEFDLIIQGITENQEITEILEEAGGKTKRITKLKAKGRPEYIIWPKNERVVLLVECKADRINHQSDHLNKPSKFNVDGALHYAEYFKEKFDALFLVVSGNQKKDLEISFGVWRKGQKSYEPIKEEKEIIPWKEYFQRIEQKPHGEVINNVRDFAVNLHNKLRTCGFTEEDKPLFISACLIALKDEKFSNDILTNSFRSDKKILYALKHTIEDTIETKHQELTDSLIRVLKNKKLLTPYHNKLSIKYILENLQKNIFPLMNSSNIDVIGEFYHEFLKYSGGDAKGLGIVLTPSHIADLFTELVDLKSTDKVLDICCGTGSFLVASFSKMNKEARIEEKEQIKENLFGIESQNKIYNLVVTNMIIRGDGKSNLYNTSCFDKGKLENKDKIEAIVKNKCNIGFLNPPYSQDDYSEGEFVFHLLNLISKGGKSVVIVPLHLAIGSKFRQIRESLLKKHTLKAVMTMPSDLFFNNNSGSHTCIMVWISHEPHQGKTWLANWQDDGFTVFKKKRIERDNQWISIKNKWLKMYRNQEEIKGISILTNLDKNKSWLPEDHFPFDYEKLNNEYFQEGVRDYLGYIMLISSNEVTSSTSFTKLTQSLEQNSFTFLSLNTEEWKEFSLINLFEIERARGETFRISLASSTKKENSIPLISTKEVNNGCVGFIDYSDKNKPKSKNCLTAGVFGTFFYQPIDFYLSYSSDNDSKVLCLRSKGNFLNEKRGLFISISLRSVCEGKWTYGRQLNEGKLKNLTIKLPVNKNHEPDWNFMEKYIEHIINRLSLSLSLWKWNFYKN